MNYLTSPTPAHRARALALPRRARGGVIAALGLTLALIGGLAATPAQADDDRRTITVSAQGTATGRPDRAQVSTGVVTQAKTAQDALTANTQAMQEIFQGLKEMGFEDRDLRTSQFNVSPQYTRPGNGPGRQEPPVISGYQVTNQLTIIIRDIDQVGQTLDQLVTLGSNQLHGIRFEISEPEPLLDQARAAAVEEALRKAKLYVNAAGVALGEIISISESSGYNPGPMYARAMMMESADVPVAPGEQQLTATVNLVIAIE